MAGGPVATAEYRGQVEGHSHDIHSGAAAAQKGQQTPGRGPQTVGAKIQGPPTFPFFPFWDMARDV